MADIYDYSQYTDDELREMLRAAKQCGVKMDLDHGRIAMMEQELRSRNQPIPPHTGYIADSHSHARALFELE